MNAVVRVLEHPSESGEGLRVFGRAMIGLTGIAALDPERALEPGRFFGAFDGNTVVAGADSYTSTLVVPGGKRIPHAAVTHVGVLPTHTRQGLLTSLIRAQLTDFAARGELVATLRASEATIYGRFGYGVATKAASIEVTTGRAVLRPGVRDIGRVSVLDDTDPSFARDVYEKAAWVGAIGRFPHWWNSQHDRRTAAKTPSYLVGVEHEGVATGYARYRPIDTDRWFTSDRREVMVDDLVALDEGAYIALVRHLIGLDLVDRVTFAVRPVDDPLPELLVDRRAARVGAGQDETWLRLVDVHGALAARTYGDGAPVVIRVSDELLASNNGTLEVGPNGVRSVESAPDVDVDVAGLGAAYLGGTPWRHLALAGRAHGLTEGAIERADALFATPRAPFSGTMF